MKLRCRWKFEIGVQLSVAVVCDLPRRGQTRIVAEVERRLSVVEELEAVVKANLQRATRLRQSILQRAFEGKLLISELDRLVPVSEDFPALREFRQNSLKSDC